MYPAANPLICINSIDWLLFVAAAKYQAETSYKRFVLTHDFGEFQSIIVQVASGRVKFPVMGAGGRSFSITVDEEASKESFRPEEMAGRIFEGPLEGSMPISQV